MAMTSAGMRDAIASAMGVSDPSALAQIGKMTTAIVTYIQANAVVTVSTSDTITTAQLLTTLCAAPGSPLTGTIATTGSGAGTIK